MSVPKSEMVLEHVLAQHLSHVPFSWQAVSGHICGRSCSDLCGSFVGVGCRQAGYWLTCSQQKVFAFAIEIRLCLPAATCRLRSYVQGDTCSCHSIVHAHSFQCHSKVDRSFFSCLFKKGCARFACGASWDFSCRSINCVLGAAGILFASN